MARIDVAETSQPLGDWLELIQAEYREMPGLNLTLPQARRLWGLDEPTTSAVFEALVATQFLKRTWSGTYIRADVLRAAHVRRG